MALRAEAVPSSSDRIAAKELRGVVGDAWLPVDMSDTTDAKTDGQKALTVSARGLDAELMRRLVFEDGMLQTPLHKPVSDWHGDLWLSASVLVRGQGKTDGFHEQRVPIPAPSQPRVFGPPKEREPLLQLSKTAIEMAGDMQYKVLKPAIFAFLEGGREELRLDRDVSQMWWGQFGSRFGQSWSEDFFPWLWSIVDPSDDESALRRWAEKLRTFALEVFREALLVMPERSGHRWRSRTRAERIFWGSINRNFPLLKEVGNERVPAA